MTIANNIKELRKKSNLSQEAFAELINVSRSAVAKWETGNGLPDISNLKSISEVFSISIDSLLDNNLPNKNILSRPLYMKPISTYLHEYMDIELTGWNDAIFKSLIFGEDENFFYYQRIKKNQPIFGLVGKKYIKSIKPSKKSKILKDVNIEQANINLDYFCKKFVKIECYIEGGILGFFDMKNDDYSKIIIDSFDNLNVILEYGRNIPIAEICKIEEIFYEKSLLKKFKAIFFNKTDLKTD